MSANQLAFEDWKVCLHSNCQLMDKVLGYNNLGEECLKLLWEAGTEPSVEGIISGGLDRREALLGQQQPPKP